MQGSTRIIHRFTIPAKDFLDSRDNELTLARYWQRHLLHKRLPPPKLVSTTYERHSAFVANVPTSHDLRAGLTPDERRAVDQFSDCGPDTDKTYIMPVVTRQQLATSPIRYVTYRRLDNPLLLLYGAICAAVRAFARPPDVLFINNDQERALADEMERVHGHVYNKKFYLFDKRAVNGTLKSYAVLNEDEMPDQLMRLFPNGIPHDLAIAVLEGAS